MRGGARTTWWGMSGRKRITILSGSYGKERGRYIAQRPAHYINSTISLTTNTTQYGFCVPRQLASSRYSISGRWQRGRHWWRPPRCWCWCWCSRVGRRDDRFLLRRAIRVWLDLVDLAFRFLPGFQVLRRRFKVSMSCLELWRAHLLTPLLVVLGHSDTHLPHISDLLPLEPIQVRLDGRRRVLQVLRGDL
jgi:hypothetical protein